MLSSVDISTNKDHIRSVIFTYNLYGNCVGMSIFEKKNYIISYQLCDNWDTLDICQDCFSNSYHKSEHKYMCAALIKFNKSLSIEPILN